MTRLALIGTAMLTLSAWVDAQAPTMRAVVVREFGGPETVRLEDVPRPVPGPGELLIEVRAAGVNPVDVAVLGGRFPVGRERPFGLGVDLAGVVAARGADVTTFAVGDPVYAYLPVDGRGTFAEYVIAKAGEIARKPASLDFAEAASAPLGVLTAQRALFTLGKLQAGETVLIQGASGGVGGYAIQLAKAAGARVIGVASTANQVYMRQLGADVTIDYTTQRFEDVVKDVDLVIDTVGGETQARSFAVLKRGGRLATLRGQPSQEMATRYGVRAVGVSVGPDAAQLTEAARLFDARRIRPIEAARLPLGDVGSALAQVATRHTRGKIVLVP